MTRTLISLLILSCVGPALQAQVPVALPQSTVYVTLTWDVGTSVPTGCTPPGFYYNTGNSSLYTCTGSTFVAVSGGAGPAGAGNNALCKDASGSGTAYTCPTPTPTVNTLSGLFIAFQPGTTNGATPTLNVGGLGAKLLKLSDCSTAIPTASLLTTGTYLFAYNGTSFCQESPGGPGANTNVIQGNGVGGVQDSTKATPTGAFVGTTDTQTLTNKTLTTPAITNPTITSFALGTPVSGVLTNETGLPLTTGVTGTLPRANGGTNNTSGTTPQQFFGTLAPTSVTGNLPGDFYSDTSNHNDYWCNAPNGTSAPACTTVTPGGWTLLNGGGGGGVSSVTGDGVLVTNSASTGAVTLTLGKAIPAGVIVGTTDSQTLTNKTLTSPTLTTPALGTPSAGVLTNATGLPLTTGVTGTLPRANGGTNNTAGAVPQLFFGTAAPGSVAGNLPGDLFSDTTNHNDYWCGATSGTAAPACTTVATGSWTLLNGGGGVSSVTAASPLSSTGGTTPQISIGSTINRTFGGTNNTAGAIPQLFFGTAAPGSVVGNLPGDLFSDTTNHNFYSCNKPSGTSAPACTTVASGNWQLLNVGGSSTVSTVNGISPTAGNVNVLTTSVFDAGQTVTAAACATDCTTVFSTAINQNGVTVELPAVTAILTNVTFNATNTIIHCNGTIIQAKSGDTGILLTVNGTNPTIENCIFDGHRETGMDQTFGLVAASGISGTFVFRHNEIKNTGDYPSANFHESLTTTNTACEIYGNRIHDMSGYGLFLRTKDKCDVHDNEIYNSSKQGIMANTAIGDYTPWTIHNNYVHDITDSNSAFGSYGNGINIFQTWGVDVADNRVENTEYSGIRCAACFTANIHGNKLKRTGDWGVYTEFQASDSNITGNSFDDCASGGIYAANGAANGITNNWSTNITGNQLTNCGVGSSTNGATTPYFGEAILVTRFSNVTGNTINGAFFGIGVEGTGSTKLAAQAVNIRDNLIMDGRTRTIAATSPTGATVVVGDTLFVGSSVDTATKVCTVTAVASSTSFACTPAYGVLAASDVLVDQARTGGATISTVVGPTLYNLTVSTTTNFNLGDRVTIGTSVGYVVCVGARIASGACPTALHLIVSVEDNSSGLKVAFPASGTLTDATTSATATISASAATTVGLSAGILFNLGDNTTYCTQFASGNVIYGYSTQAMGAWSANSTTVSALPTSACPDHPVGYLAPTISGGGGTIAATFVGTPTDNAMTVNEGTGTLSSVVITFSVPYTSTTPACQATDQTSAVALRLTPTITTLTLASTNLVASDKISIMCVGGN